MSALAARLTAVREPALGFVALLVLTWRVLSRGMSAAPAGDVLAIVDGANLIFHEAGHLIFILCGDFLHALGGSLVQVAMPLICAAYFLMHRHWGSCAVATFWMGENLCGVGIYMADAARMQLPLFGEGHDWNYLLGRLGMLGAADALGRLVFVVGVIAMVAAVGGLGLEVLRRYNEPRGES